MGKRTATVELAATLNCQRPGSAACGECDSCRRVFAGSHPDFKILNLRNQGNWIGDDEPAREEGPRQLLSIRAVRGMLHDAARRPFLGRWKVYLIENAERLQIDAANRLLKELEEPPAHTVFVLTTTDASQIIDTVASRCRHVAFAPVRPAAIRRYLTESLECDDLTAHRLAQLARGRPGWAIEAARDPAVAELAERHSREPIELFSQSIASRLRLSPELVAYWGRDPIAGQERLDLWAASLWECLLARSDSANRATPAAEVNEEEFVRGLRLVRRTVRYLRANVPHRLAFDTLLLEYPLAK